MSLRQWAENGRLKPHQTGQKKIRDLSGAEKVEKLFKRCNIHRASSDNIVYAGKRLKAYISKPNLNSLVSRFKYLFGA
jgi:hypothetical protein